VKIDLACGADPREGYEGVAELRGALGEGYDGITADFEVVSKEAVLNQHAVARFGKEGIPQWMLEHCVNVIDDVHVVLKKR
jgi:hypothetical protein